MNNYRTAINEIIRFKETFDSIDPKIPKKLVGEIGEYYVLNEFKKSGLKNIKHKGGQSGYDIYLGDIDKRIEVRSSLLKNEGIYRKDILFYGWRVQNQNQKAGKFDYMVGVALSDSFKRAQFYIFTHKEAFSVDDVSIGRFSSLKKKINLFKNKTAFKEAVKTKPNLVTKYERYINRYPDKFLNRWDKIKAG